MTPSSCPATGKAVWTMELCHPEAFRDQNLHRRRGLGLDVKGKAEGRQGACRLLLILSDEVLSVNCLSWSLLLQQNTRGWVLYGAQSIPREGGG